MAEKYYQNLAITAIVTPAIRAVDEKTGVNLMSNYQELRMQLDGKYNKDSFCVVVSKIDDMDCDAFCKGSKEARQDAKLQAEAGEIKSISDYSKKAYGNLRRTVKRLDRAIQRSSALEATLQTWSGAGISTPLF